MSMVLAPYSVVTVSTSLSLSGESRWKMWTFPSRVEPSFGGPEYVLQYLGRYTHRVAISNHRLVSFADGQVTFRWRDSADGNKQKLLPLSVNEFLTRFLLHILPQGFVRIRNFGFLANRRRSTLVPLSAFTCWAQPITTCRRTLLLDRRRATSVHCNPRPFPQLEFA